MFLLGHSQNNFRPYVYIPFLISTNFIQFQLDKCHLTFFLMVTERLTKHFLQCLKCHAVDIYKSSREMDAVEKRPACWRSGAQWLCTFWSSFLWAAWGRSTSPGHSPKGGATAITTSHHFAEHFRGAAAKAEADWSKPGSSGVSNLLWRYSLAYLQGRKGREFGRLILPSICGKSVFSQSTKGNATESLPRCY